MDLGFDVVVTITGIVLVFAIPKHANGHHAGGQDLDAMNGKRLQPRPLLLQLQSLQRPPPSPPHRLPCCTPGGAGILPMLWPPSWLPST